MGKKRRQAEDVTIPPNSEATNKVVATEEVSTSVLPTPASTPVQKSQKQDTSTSVHDHQRSTHESQDLEYEDVWEDEDEEDSADDVVVDPDSEDEDGTSCKQQA